MTEYILRRRVRNKSKIHLQKERILRNEVNVFNGCCLSMLLFNTMQNSRKKKFQPVLALKKRPIAHVTNGIIGSGNGPLNNGLLQVGNEIYTTTNCFIRDGYEYPSQAGQFMDIRFPYELHKFPKDIAGLQLVKVPQVCVTDNSNKPINNINERKNNEKISKPSNFALLENNNYSSLNINKYYNYFWYNYYQQQLHLQQQLLQNYWSNYLKSTKLASNTEQYVQLESQHKLYKKVS